MAASWPVQALSCIQWVRGELVQGILLADRLVAPGFPLCFHDRRFPAGGPYRWQVHTGDPILVDASSWQYSNVALGLRRGNLLQPFGGNFPAGPTVRALWSMVDRKSTRLNSSHLGI